MIYDILKKKYPNAKITNLEGGYTNNTFLLENTGLFFVAKIYRNENKDALTEVNALKMLNYLNISPHVYDSFEYESNLCVIMDYIPGTNGQQYLDCGDIDKARDMYKLLGFHLAHDIHSIKINNNFTLPSIGLFNLNEDSLIPNNLFKDIKNVLNIKFQNNITLVHGDFGPHNIILQQENIKIIDWEWAGWGNPLQDIAWVVWFLHLHYPNLCKDLCKVFLCEYRLHSNIEINKFLIKAFALSRVLMILSSISESNIEDRTEWVRRLIWTLKTEFIV